MPKNKHEKENVSRTTDILDTKFYLNYRLNYRRLVKRAERISYGAGGISATGNRMFWGCALFTRITVTAKSIDKLLPSPKIGAHWDFGSIASLARNLFEAILVFHWLCGQGVDDVEREGRFILYDLHDRGSRRRLFPETPEPPEALEDLVKRFNSNQFLAKFKNKQRIQALNGERTPFIQDEALTQIGIDLDEFRMLYRFFSQYTHCGPLSFYRILENKHGTGVESQYEKRYMIYTMEYLSIFLSLSIDTLLDIVPNAETCNPFSKNHNC